MRHQERPRRRPVESRDLVPSLARDRNRSQDQDQDQDQDLDQSRDRGRDRVRVRVRCRGHIHHRNLDRRLDRARVLSHVRRLNHAVNHNRDLDPAVLNRETHRDPSRDRVQDRLRNHHRDLCRPHYLCHRQDRDPVLVAVPLARPAKAAPRANESRPSRRAINNTNVINSFSLESLFQRMFIYTIGIF